MKMQIGAVALVAVTLAACANPKVPEVNTIQAGDSTLSCSDLEQQIALMESVIAKTEQIISNGGASAGIAGTIFGVFGPLITEKLKELENYAVLTNGMQLADQLAELTKNPSLQKASSVRTNALQRRDLLVQRHIVAC